MSTFINLKKNLNRLHLYIISVFTINYRPKLSESNLEAFSAFPSTLSSSLAVPCRICKYWET